MNIEATQTQQYASSDAPSEAALQALADSIVDDTLALPDHAAARHRALKHIDARIARYFAARQSASASARVLLAAMLEMTVNEADLHDTSRLVANAPGCQPAIEMVALRAAQAPQSSVPDSGSSIGTPRLQDAPPIVTLHVDTPWPPVARAPYAPRTPLRLPAAIGDPAWGAQSLRRRRVIGPPRGPEALEQLARRQREHTAGSNDHLTRPDRQPADGAALPVFDPLFHPGAPRDTDARCDADQSAPPPYNFEVLHESLAPESDYAGPSRPRSSIDISSDFAVAQALQMQEEDDHAFAAQMELDEDACATASWDVESAEDLMTNARLINGVLVPSALICPLTQRLFTNPLFDKSTGRTVDGPSSAAAPMPAHHVRDQGVHNVLAAWREHHGDETTLGSALREVLTCTITQDLFEHPVIAADGHTYEGDAIRDWLREQPRSPMTREPLPLGDLWPAQTLIDLMEQFGLSTASVTQELNGSMGNNQMWSSNS